MVQGLKNKFERRIILQEFKKFYLIPLFFIRYGLFVFVLTHTLNNDGV